MSNDQSALISWVLAGVASVIAALSSALTWIYKKQIANYETNIAEAIKEKVELKSKLEAKIEHLEKKVDSCESEHMAAKIELAKINERLRLLESRGGLSGSCHIQPLA